MGTSERKTKQKTKTLNSNKYLQIKEKRNIAATRKTGYYQIILVLLFSTNFMIVVKKSTNKFLFRHLLNVSVFETFFQHKKKYYLCVIFLNKKRNI